MRTLRKRLAINLGVKPTENAFFSLGLIKQKFRITIFDEFLRSFAQIKDGEPASVGCCAVRFVNPREKRYSVGKTHALAYPPLARFSLLLCLWFSVREHVKRK